MSDKLPDYGRHPLDETVMGLQFQPLQFGIQHLIQYWSTIRDKYPSIEEQAVLPHTIESPTIQRAELPKFVIAEATKFPMSRFWLADPSGNNLIQLQNDRFLKNWRRRTGNEVYPRYSALSETFWREWTGFQAFLKEAKIDEPKIDQCELTYVNFIDVEEIAGGLSGMANAFSVFNNQRRDGFLPAPEILKWESSYVLPQGRGRLHVTAAPSFRQRDFKLIINFTLNARGRPLWEANEQLGAWFDLSHEWIVRSFDELTTPEMHKTWKKKYE